MTNARRRRIGASLAIVALVATIGVSGGRSVDATRERGAGPTSPSTSTYVAVGPIRLADTREPSCGCTRLDDHTIRVSVADRAGVDQDVIAAAVTVTIVQGPRDGYATAFPAGTAVPATSTVNATAGATASNSTIVMLGSDGAVDVYASTVADLVVDVTGVFVGATGATAGRYQPIAPTRLLDTRVARAAPLAGGEAVTIGLPAEVPTDATAVAVNVTSVGALAPGFVVGYAAGATRPSTSFLNPDGSGQPKAATVILPVSASGLTLSTNVGGHLVVDLNGWFTGPSAPSSTTGMFVPTAPARVVDTRVAGPRVWPFGTREVAAPITGASAVVTNVTIDRTDGMGFVTAYPAGTPLPDTSSLNSPGFEATVANLAITTVSDRGIAYYANGGTDVIVDVTGSFIGQPVPATLPVASNTPPYHRAMLVGDSTLGAVQLVTGTKRAMQGFDYIIDAANCRRLVNQGCKSDYTPIAPTTVVDALLSAPGRLDIVVIKAGYNDPLTPFAPAVDEIVAAARAKGAKWILWLTFSNSDSQLEYLLEEDNAILARMAGSPAYPDLVAIDWRNYAPPSTGVYIADRHHLNLLGAWATADYIARWIAHLEHRPCPAPWTSGGAIDNPCPNPDLYAAAAGALPSLKALYGF